MSPSRLPGRGLVRVLPLADRVWGEALLAELEAVPLHRRPRWVCALLWLGLVRRARQLGLACRRHVLGGGDLRTGASVGGVAGVAVVADLAYTNLGPAAARPASEPVVPVVIACALIGALFVAIGCGQRRRGQPVSGGARAAAAAAVAIVVLAFVTSLVIDNVWLSEVARQPDKLYGLAHSPLFHTMRAYLIGQNVLGLIVVTPLAALGAAALGALGAQLPGAAPATSSRAR